MFPFRNSFGGCFLEGIKPCNSVFPVYLSVSTIRQKKRVAGVPAKRRKKTKEEMTNGFFEHLKKYADCLFLYNSVPFYRHNSVPRGPG